MPQTLSTSSFKTKILRILAVLVTLALIAGGIWVLSRMVRRIDISNDKTTFFENTNYDVLFFGTSHVRVGISPFQLYKDYGITSYNWGTNGQEIPISYWALINSMKYNKPKFVFLDVYGCRLNFLDIDEKISGHLIFDNFPISKNKIQGIIKLYEESDVKKELLFPYFSYHNRWSEGFISPWKKINKNLANGYEDVMYLKREISDYKNMRKVNKNEYIDNENTDGMKYIKEFVFFCRKNNIQPVLMYIPPACGVLQQKESNSVQKLAGELNVPYYNMLYNAEDIIDMNIDLLDCYIGKEDIENDSLVNGNIHLNPSGARKVTDYIGNILRNDFNVPDHRGEAVYAKWDEDYKEYRNYIFGKMRGINDFGTLLMSCNFADISVKLFTAENVSFDNVEQKLIAQLKDNIEIILVSRQETDYDVRIAVTDDITGEMITEKSFNIGSAFHAK